MYGHCMNRLRVMVSRQHHPRLSNEIETKKKRNKNMAGSLDMNIILEVQKFQNRQNHSGKETRVEVPKGTRKYSLRPALGNGRGQRWLQMKQGGRSQGGLDHNLEISTNTWINNRVETALNRRDHQNKRKGLQNQRNRI